MNDINVLDGRIRAALERVRQGLEKPVAAAPVADGAPADDAAALRTQLDEERTVNAQLEERVRALKERQDSKLGTLEAQVEAQGGQLADYDREMQRLQQANAELRAVAAELREALMEEVAEPELINRAAIAELDALRAVQAADRAEVDGVMAQLAPLLQEAT